MKVLTIRGLPDEVHARLKEQAKRNRRSLNQEVIAELVASCVTTDHNEKVDEVLKAVHYFRSSLKKPLTQEEIREAIAEGRA